MHESRCMLRHVADSEKCFRGFFYKASLRCFPFPRLVRGRKEGAIDELQESWMKKPRRQLSVSGGESEHGQVCHRCGWAYPNPHPSAKLRRAHRKHCAASIGGCAAELMVLEGSDSRDLMKTSTARDLESIDEIAVEKSKTELETLKSFENGMMVENDADDNAPESYASVLGNKIKGLECKQTKNEFEGTSHFNHTLIQKTDNAGFTEDAKDSCSSESKSHLLDAFKEQSSLQGFKDIGSAEDTINRTPLDFATATIPPGDSEITSSFIASKSQRINECMGANESFNDESTVTSPTTVLPSHFSNNLIKFDSHISVRQYKHTNEDGGPLSQQELFYKDGSSTLESSAGHNLDTSSEPDSLVSELVVCQRNANEAESGCSLPATSLTSLEEVSEAKPEVHQELADNTIVHVIDVGVKSVYCLEYEESKVLLAELEVLGSKDIPSTLQINDKIPSYCGNGSATESANSNYGQNKISLPVDSDGFQLSRECHSEAEIPVANSKHSEGLEVYLLHKQGQYPNLEARIQDKDLNSHVTSSHGTSFSSAQSEELESPSDEYVSITSSSSEGTSANCVTVGSFDITSTNLGKANQEAYPNGSAEMRKQCNGEAEINSKTELISDEEEHDDKDLNVMKPTKEAIQKNCYAETEKISKGEVQPQAQKVVNNTDIGINELLKRETTADQNGSLSIQYAELSSSYSDNYAQSYPVQKADQKAPGEGSGENGVSRSLDQSDRQENVKEANSEVNLCKEHHDKLDPCKTETEPANGSQLELQSISQVRTDELAVNEESNTERDHQISQTDEENRNINNALNLELGSNESTEVDLGHEEDPNLRIEEQLTATSESNLLVKDPAPSVDSKDCCNSGVAPSTYYPYPQQQEVHVESKQQPESFMKLIDDFVDSNGQTSNKEELWSYESDEMNPFLEAAANAVPFNSVTSPPPDTQNEMFPCTSELAAENEVTESKLERDYYFSTTSPATLDGHGKRLVSNEIQSASSSSSKNKPEGNKNEEVSTKMANTDAEKPHVHVMLKSLLAESNNESGRKLMNGENKNNKGWSPPAWLPNSKHVKRKTKGKQGWIPFMCCQPGQVMN